MLLSQELPNATAYELVDQLNQIIKPNFNPGIEIININKGTAFVKILNSDLLTQGMGTYGAFSYLAKVTFTLTSIPNIKYINYDFKIGDHAKPGTKSRISYIEWLQ